MTETQAMPETSVFEEAYPIQATLDRVWTALTDPEALRVWFTEHAEVDLRPGGAYRFWCRHTPYFGGPVTSDQVIAELDRIDLGFDKDLAGQNVQLFNRLA